MTEARNPGTPLTPDWFEGITVKGAPKVTLSQGKVVWRDGQLDVVRGAGRNVARPAMAPMFEAQSAWNELTRPRGVRSRNPICMRNGS